MYARRDCLSLLLGMFKHEYRMVMRQLGHWTCAIAVIAEYGVNVFARDNDGMTPLDMLEWHNATNLHAGVCEYVREPATWPPSLKCMCRAVLLQNPMRQALIHALPVELHDYVGVWRLAQRQLLNPGMLTGLSVTDDLAHAHLSSGAVVSELPQVHPHTVYAVMSRTDVRLVPMP